MKVSKIIGERFRENPSDSNTISYSLLIRGGYIKQMSSGIFSNYYPLVRITKKIEAILCKYMDKLDGQEVKLPVVMPADLWKKSDRYYSIGEELVRFKDRNNTDMVLGMTHEEAAVHLVKDFGKNPNVYPFMIYQIQTKFRDEARSRGGLIRVREFTMKDAYSFHTLRSGSISIRFTRSRVTMSNSLADLLYSTGFPAAAMTQPEGTGWVPNVLFCRNCSIVGTRVSETQLISSIKRIPSLHPVCSIFS